MRKLVILNKLTDRSLPSLEKYLQDVKKYGLVTVEEEIELANKIKKGDREALEKLVKANLRFVVSVAKQYQNQGLTLSDLINEGNIGLIEAATRFDATRGFKFISYAVWWIRQSIMQAISNNTRMIRLPVNKLSELNKIKNATTDLQQELEREPTFEEIATKLSLSEHDIEQSMGNKVNVVSADAPINDHDDGSIMDLLNNDESEMPDMSMHRNSLQVEIERALSLLDPRDADIIRKYYGLGGEMPYTLSEIGEEFGLTRERVRQIKEASIAKMRKITKNKVLNEYLD
ncbi:MAG: RNA polymerase sigma factor RpoD/SigA [Bacteroidales bacterium]|nr:RNA polymerase sigma factor RpoD/SigA [Bacteroidales bacterium]MCF8387661.1 RNA polymerase sigma factor RpoD/SigA [Bacteroidales bacterium]MCF8398625.1 RNA polymerase sigma factor RpoD/SigA [Bacteroidales bacterium]